MGEKCVVMERLNALRLARVRRAFQFQRGFRVNFWICYLSIYTTKASCNEYNRRISLGSLITCGKEITSTRNIACVALRTKRSCLVGRAR